MQFPAKFWRGSGDVEAWNSDAHVWSHYLASRGKRTVNSLSWVWGLCQGKLCSRCGRTVILVESQCDHLYNSHTNRACASSWRRVGFTRLPPLQGYIGSLWLLRHKDIFFSNVATGDFLPAPINDPLAIFLYITVSQRIGSSSETSEERFPRTVVSVLSGGKGHLSFSPGKAHSRVMS